MEGAASVTGETLGEKGECLVSILSLLLWRACVAGIRLRFARGCRWLPFRPVRRHLLIAAFWRALEVVRDAGVPLTREGRSSGAWSAGGPLDRLPHLETRLDCSRSSRLMWPAAGASSPRYRTRTCLRVVGQARPPRATGVRGLALRARVPARPYRL